jgi:hypothetical protein
VEEASSRSHAASAEDNATMLSPEQVRDRSDLARHLRGSIFPANRDEITRCAEDEQASPSLVAALRKIPDHEYRNVEEVWEAMGGPREHGSRA